MDRLKNIDIEISLVSEILSKQVSKSLLDDNFKIE